MELFDFKYIENFLKKFLKNSCNKSKKVSYFSSINFEKFLFVCVYASSQSNHIVLSKTVKSKLAEMELSFPKGYSILNTYDSTKYINSELNRI